MTASKKSTPYDKIDALLRQVAEELPRRPDWYKAVKRLKKSSPLEDRVAAYQAVRDDGCLPEDAGFFLVSFVVDNLTTPKAERATRHLKERMDRLVEEHGLGNRGEREPSEADAEYDALEEQNLAIWDRCFAEQLAAHGEEYMADLFRRYNDEFSHRQEAGRRFFFGPLDSGGAELRATVQELFDEVRQCVHSSSPMGPLACRWHNDYGFLDVQVFPTPMELVGGPHDGAVVNPDVDFDLLQIQGVFDSLLAVTWNIESDEREYQYLCIQGQYRGRDVWLTIFAGAPEGEKPTIKSDDLRKWRALRGGDD